MAAKKQPDPIRPRTVASGAGRALDRGAFYPGKYSEMLVLSSESVAQYQELHRDYCRHFKPRNAAEQAEVDLIAWATWITMRLRRVEQAHYETRMRQLEGVSRTTGAALTSNHCLALAFEEMARSGLIDKLAREESRIERVRSQAEKRLRVLQAAPAPDPDAPYVWPDPLPAYVPRSFWALVSADFPDTEREDD
jgi:hypothetical protein